MFLYLYSLTILNSRPVYCFRDDEASRSQMLRLALPRWKVAHGLPHISRPLVDRVDLHFGKKNGPLAFVTPRCESFLDLRAQF